MLACVIALIAAAAVSCGSFHGPTVFVQDIETQHVPSVVRGVRSGSESRCEVARGIAADVYAQWSENGQLEHRVHVFFRGFDDGEWSVSYRTRQNWPEPGDWVDYATAIQGRERVTFQFAS